MDFFFNRVKKVYTLKSSGELAENFKKKIFKLDCSLKYNLLFQPSQANPGFPWFLSGAGAGVGKNGRG